MKKLLKSKIAAWGVLLLIILMIIATFSLRNEWWAFFDVFFLFMMAFTHLLALNLTRMSPAAGKKLDIITLFFAICGILSFIIEWILFNV